MSRRMVGFLAIFLAVACGAAAFVWLHSGGQNKTVVNFTPEPPAAANPSASTAPPEPSGASSPGATKAAAAAPAGPADFVPPIGEVLEFSGSVAKVNNVA